VPDEIRPASPVSEPPKPALDDKTGASPSAEQARTTPNGQSSQPEASQPTESSATARQPKQVIDPQKQQRADRAENQDYVRVLGMYGGASIPQVYIEHINVAGDMGVGGQDTRGAEVFPPPNRDSAQVSPREIQKIQRVYQRHAAYAVAVKALKDNRCVVLRGKLQVGKRAAAIHLALELRGQDANIWELSAEDDLVGQIKRTALKPGMVYLVDGLLRDKGRAIKSQEAYTMLDTLAKNECYLIVCARPDVSFPPQLKVVTLEPLPVPTIQAVIEAHLNYYGLVEVEQVRTVFENNQVKGWLQKGLLPAQADRLARQVAEGLQDDKPLEETLHGYETVTEDEARQWLEETADNLEESAFRISLAMFSGSRYTAVQAAAQDLNDRLRPEPHPKPETDAPLLVSPLKKESRSARLQKAHAKLVNRSVPTEYSDNAIIQVVELENPGYTHAMLSFLWNEIDEWRKPLLDWLCDCAVDAPHDLRLRAAGAIGALAAIDFDYIRAQVFRKWAYSGQDDPDARRAYYQAIGNALGVLVWNESHVEDVLGLLRAWVDDGSPALRWAAARAYAQVGLLYPREAIYQWRRILESEASLKIELTESFRVSVPHPVHMSVIDALISLFARAVEVPHRFRPVYEQAIDGLGAWVETDTEERGSEQAGLPLFLVLTAIRYPPEDGSGDPEEWPPAMLYIVGTQPDSAYRRVLAALLRRALGHPRLDTLAAAALEFWVTYADKDDWLETALTVLLAELLAISGISERERGRLRMYLTRWANRPKSPLRVAGRLLTALHLAD